MGLFICVCAIEAISMNSSNVTSPTTIYNASGHMEDNSNLVTIRIFASESEAEIAKSALEAFGIDCMISRDDCGGQRPHLIMGEGIRLVIRSGDVRRAEDVLTTGGEDSD